MAQEITQLLADSRKGNQAASDQIIRLVYEDLHRLAERYLNYKHGDLTLQTTAQVNETYLRLVGTKPIASRDRGHFFALAAKQMRRICVDAARKLMSQKCDHDLSRVSLDKALVVSDVPLPELVALDEALDSLEQFDPRACRVVELRFFAGLSVEETADALGVSTDVVTREWLMAKTWLWGRLNHDKQREYDYPPDKDDHPLGEAIWKHSVHRLLPHLNIKAINFSETRSAFYLLFSAVVSCLLLRFLTDQEAVIALGTLNIAIIGMWFGTVLAKIRSLFKMSGT